MKKNQKHASPSPHSAARFCFFFLNEKKVVLKKKIKNVTRTRGARRGGAMRAPRVRVTFFIFFYTFFIRYNKKSKTRRGGAMRVFDFFSRIFTRCIKKIQKK